jgi:hypothetical protein
MQSVQDLYTPLYASRTRGGYVANVTPFLRIGYGFRVVLARQVPQILLLREQKAPKTRDRLTEKGLGHESSDRCRVQANE